MKKIVYIIPLLLLILSCQKEREKDVQYVVTKSISGFEVYYRIADGTIAREWISTASAEDRWTYGFQAEQGEIVYLSARYTDITSAISVQIIIDGKVYKQGSSAQDTVRYVTVSGTVPYE